MFYVLCLRITKTVWACLECRCPVPVAYVCRCHEDVVGLFGCPNSCACDRPADETQLSIDILVEHEA